MSGFLNTVLEKLKSADFVPYLHQPFHIHSGSVPPFPAELIEVAELGSAKEQSGSAKRRAFSVVFRGPPKTNLPQAIYTVRHEKMGTLELFLVPIGPDSQGMRYEAIFA